MNLNYSNHSIDTFLAHLLKDVGLLKIVNVYLPKLHLTKVPFSATIIQSTAFEVILKFYRRYGHGPDRPAMFAESSLALFGGASFAIHSNESHDFTQWTNDFSAWFDIVKSDSIDLVHNMVIDFHHKTVLIPERANSLNPDFPIELQADKYMAWGKCHENLKKDLKQLISDNTATIDIFRK